MKEHTANKRLNKVRVGSRMYMFLFLSVFLLTSVCQAAPATPLKDKFKGNDDTKKVVEYEGTMFINTNYLAVRSLYNEKGYKPAKGINIELGIDDIVVPNEEYMKISSGIGGIEEQVFIWEEECEWVEWLVDIPEEGLYEIAVEYYPLPGTGVDIIRELMINGEVPFIEAHNIAFTRLWKDEAEPKVNSIGDEVRPRQEEVFKWRVVNITDSGGIYSDPLCFYFHKGKNRIRMIYLDQPMAIRRIIVKSPDIIPAYEEILSEYKAKGYNDAAESIKFQAESNIIYKTNPTIRLETHGDPLCEPRSIANVKLNVIGGDRWRTGNQTITWKFSVPEDGLYKIALRLGQWWRDGLPSYRQIAIDGKIPFEEMREYKFEFDTGWRTEELKNSSGEPYLFYLTKGEHELSMTVKMGPIGEIIQSLTSDIELLSDILLQIVMITGESPDYNYEYDLELKVPNLIENLQFLSDSMQNKVDVLSTISNRRLPIANNLLSIKEKIDAMIADPSRIPRYLSDLNEAQISIGSWIDTLKQQQLILDYFCIMSPSERCINKKSNIFQRMYTTLMNFIASFHKDYDNIGAILFEDEEGKVIKENKTINVWVGMGREWAQLLKEIADTDFTPKTGIRININVLPSSQLNTGSTSVLMLSIISGRAPDVALGVSSDTPVEFAIRGAVKNLKQFDDFDSVYKRFLPGIMIPYEYQGGVYALPQTMGFNVLFYRKDIMSQLGLSIPDTWEEVYEDILPVLYQNRMTFAPGDAGSTFGAFLRQRGGDYYTEDGTRSALDTPEAYQAFKEWTELYTNYGMPVSINFFNRIRTGTTPIGIGGYDLYMKLLVAAPELLGKWGVALMPGYRKPDGSIDRSAVGGATGQAVIILEQSKNSEEAWEFLKWWTSKDTQVMYGREIEALLGPEARWNTSNMEAFDSLPWKKEDIEIIKEQWKWNKEQPIVAGGYFTSRHLTNAFTRTVMAGVPPRDSLEQAVEEINKELKSKQEEFGIGIYSNENPAKKRGYINE